MRQRIMKIVDCVATISFILLHMKGHTNVTGATKIANYLGKYITENYDVSDKRTQENNIWEQALKSRP